MFFTNLFIVIQIALDSQNLQASIVPTIICTILTSVNNFSVLVLNVYFVGHHQYWTIKKLMVSTSFQN